MSIPVVIDGREFDVEGHDKVIVHHGWLVRLWTGWKGTKSTVSVRGASCWICNSPLLIGEFIKLEQGVKPSHWLCMHPSDYYDRHMGQWCAVKLGKERGQDRYCAVNVDNLDATIMPAHEYKKGDSFAVSSNGVFITENTPEEEKNKARDKGLAKLLNVIERLES